MYAHTTIGIDLGIVTKHRVCALTTDPPDRVMSVRPRPAELDAMLDAVGGPDHVDVVLEPTGLSWVPVSSYLIEKGCCVSLVDTRKATACAKCSAATSRATRPTPGRWRASDSSPPRTLARCRSSTEMRSSWRG